MNSYTNIHFWALWGQHSSRYRWCSIHSTIFCCFMLFIQRALSKRSAHTNILSACFQQRVGPKMTIHTCEWHHLHSLLLNTTRWYTFSIDIQERVHFLFFRSSIPFSLKNNQIPTNDRWLRLYKIQNLQIASFSCLAAFRFFTFCWYTILCRYFCTVKCSKKAAACCWKIRSYGISLCWPK